MYVVRYHIFTLLVSHAPNFIITCFPFIFTANLSDDAALLVAPTSVCLRKERAKLYMYHMFTFFPRTLIISVNLGMMLHF